MPPKGSLPKNRIFTKIFFKYKQLNPENSRNFSPFWLMKSQIKVYQAVSVFHILKLTREINLNSGCFVYIGKCRNSCRLR
jgi:hypothetical protein